MYCCVYFATNAHAFMWCPYVMLPIVHYLLQRFEPWSLLLPHISMCCYLLLTTCCNKCARIYVFLSFAIYMLQQMRFFVAANAILCCSKCDYMLQQIRPYLCAEIWCFLYVAKSLSLRLYYWNVLHLSINATRTLQYTATHYNTLQHTATHCSTPIHHCLFTSEHRMFFKGALQ